MEGKFDQIEARLKTVESSQKETLAELGDDFDDLKEGVLSIQQKGFKTMCRKLLQSPDPITYDQYDSIVNEHRIYNNLGGNHDGDELFRLVTIKYQNGLK